MTSTRVLPVMSAGLLALTALALGSCDGGGEGPAWWGLRAEVTSASETVPIVVRVGSSSCHRYEGVTTVETDEAVTITATVTSTGDRDCTADLASTPVDVVLDRPLGDRELRGCAHTDRRRCDEVSALVG